MISDKYEVELWSRNGVLVGDISRYVKSLHYTMQRNEAEQLEFEMSLDKFEEFCSSIGTNPLGVLGPYQTDIKVKRNGQYLFGTHVGSLDISLEEIDSTIKVKAFGYLNLLIDRYVSKTYIQTDGRAIAWDLIATTQAITNGSLGITQGPNQVNTKLRDRTYVRDQVKSMIVNLTNLSDIGFDFEFTYDRKFNTYSKLGTDYSASVEFVYPGNIISVQVPRNATGSLYNKIYALGAGFGRDQIGTQEVETDSQLNYGVHEVIQTWNSVSLQQTLVDNARAYLKGTKELLEIPQMTVNGNDFDLNTYGVGDTLNVRIENHPFLNTVNGAYRIEKLDVSVGENTDEEIKIYFDNTTL